MKRKSLSLTALVLALCLVLGACGSGTGSSVPADTSSAGDGSAASTGAAGEARLRRRTEPAREHGRRIDRLQPLDRYLLPMRAQKCWAVSLEGLVRQDKGSAKIEQGSGLAESWTISDDGTILYL